MLPLLLALLVMSNSYCSDSDSSTTSNGNSNGGTVTPQPTPEPGPSRLTELEKDLESVKTSVAMKEKEYLSNTGDATRATLLATSDNSSP